MKVRAPERSPAPPTPPVHRGWVLGIAMAGGLLSALAAFQWSGLVRWMANLNYDLLVECTTVGRKVDTHAWLRP
jgi:hypothetical protein